MNKLFAATILTMASLIPLGCGKVYNSSTYDASTYGSANGSANFLAAQAVIKTSCASCHTRPSHQAWGGLSEKDFIAQGLIKPASLANSTLYTKIQGNRTTVPGNMPDGGSLLTGADLDKMEAWIMGATP
ncbi:MAG: cytochrome c [Bdellovibrionaceae bacterium]|nr:cytochrome c [Pseudobdellovibrionaceae bacterium]